MRFSRPHRSNYRTASPSWTHADLLWTGALRDVACVRRQSFSERVGIFKWVVDGALAFLNFNGLTPPLEIHEATEDYRRQEDPIGTFIDDACLVTGDPGDTEKPFDLFTAYERFAIKTGAIKVKESTFYSRLPDVTRRTYRSADGKHCRIDKSRTNSGVVHCGIKIRETWLAGARDAGGSR